MKIHRRPVGARDTIDLVAHFRVDLLRPLDVVADEQIELAIIIVVDPGGARAPVHSRAAHSGRRGDLGELAVALVVKQVIAPHRGEEDVRQPVVVIIANGHPHAVETNVET